MRRVRGFNERRALEARKRPSFFEASAVNVEGGGGGGEAEKSEEEQEEEWNHVREF